jgi:hypothetical protein
VYFHHRPQLARQLAGLALLGAALLLVPHLLVYILGLAAIFAVPGGGLAGFNWLLFAYAAVALAGMILLLHRGRVTLIPALAGAHAFAFSTWFPLHLQGGRPLYALAALLPLLYVLILGRREVSTTRRRRLWSAALLFAAVIGYLAPVLPEISSVPQAIARPRDVFLDPNQAMAALKVGSDITWDHFGSYVGLINMALAAIGLVAYGREQKGIAAAGLLGILAAFTPLARLPGLPFPPQHLVILATFAIAFFAGCGLSALQRFLEAPPHSRDRSVIVSIALVALIALLDVWQVASAAFEYYG